MVVKARNKIRLFGEYPSFVPEESVFHQLNTTLSSEILSRIAREPSCLQLPTCTNRRILFANVGQRQTFIQIGESRRYSLKNYSWHMSSDIRPI